MKISFTTMCVKDIFILFDTSVSYIFYLEGKTKQEGDLNMNIIPKIKEKLIRPTTVRAKLYMSNRVIMVPLLIMVVYLIFSLVNYRQAYDNIINNMLVANSYNVNFKAIMDESLYKLSVGMVTFDTIDEDETLENPYKLIDELRSEFGQLATIATDKESRSWLISLLRNIDTLEDRIDDIRRNIEENGQYEDNMEMLDKNIYILTDLIQDDIQYYLYYQTKDIANVRNQLNHNLMTFIIVMIVAAVVITVLETAFSNYVVRTITRPVEELVKMTQLISTGNFENRVEVESRDEIAVLAQSVNDMAENLEVMVRQIKEDAKKMRYTELRLLQEQINPHFLYNTLETIVWLIQMNEPKQAVKMVMSLSDFFRLVLNKGKELITIREEEQHIRSYLEIQQVRYKDILEYEIAIDPKIYEYHIQKLTLQPLIENSLYHGIKYKRTKGLIRVTGEMAGPDIVLCVEDTGVGMDEETLGKLQEEISKPCKLTESGFGLANVSERIRMNYGKDYGMKIESTQGVGTKIVITIPPVDVSGEILEGDNL